MISDYRLPWTLAAQEQQSVATLAPPSPQGLRNQRLRHGLRQHYPPRCLTTNIRSNTPSSKNNIVFLIKHLKLGSIFQMYVYR